VKFSLISDGNLIVGFVLIQIISDIGMGLEILCGLWLSLFIWPAYDDYICIKKERKRAKDCIKVMPL
jgi:hypothetical protein